MSPHGNEPEYGRRLSPEELSARALRRPATAPAGPPRAARRMARGLSFTLVMLGVLLGAGLTALGLRWGWTAGTLLVLLGIAGFVSVQAQLSPAFRDASAPPLRSLSRLWLIPSALLLLGLVALGAVFAVEPVLAGTARAHLVAQWVTVLVVSGMTLVVAAALGFGLVAMASFTLRDDDDSPLRHTGYAEQLRRRERRDPGPPGPDYYDPGWVHHRPLPRHGPRGTARRGPDAGEDTGPPPSGGTAPG